jgi:ketosteroid isomerase-like protein
MTLFPRRLISMVALGVLLGSCTAPAPATFTEEDRAQIQATIDQALEIANTTQDWVAYGDIYYAPDIVFMPPNGEAVRGRDEVAAWTTEGTPPLEELRYELVQVEGAGDLAYVYGNYSMTVTPPEAEPTTDRGKYLEIWRRQADGSWKMALGIFNSDMPLPEG